MTGPGYPANPPYTGGPDEVVPVGGLSATGIAALAAKTAQDWEDELYGTADTFLTPISDLLGKLWGLFAEFVDIDGFIEIASDVLGFFYNLLDRAGFFDLLSGVVDFFSWLTELGVDAIEALMKPLIEFLTGLWNFVVALISGEDLQDLIEQVVNFLGGFLSGQQFADLFQTIVEFFSGLFSSADGFTASVADFINKLPLIGPIVSAITGKTEADGVTLDLSYLGTWFRGLEKQTNDGVGQLVAAAEKLLGGILPVSSINFSEPNLLSQGDFLTAGTVEAGGGWAWDGGTTASGSGGSVKATATGSLQELYSRQSIRVAAGDRVNVSAKIKTSGFTAAGGRSMVLSIIPWVGTTQQSTVTISTRTTSAASFTAMTGSVYTVPTGVTSLQVRLAVTANSGALVWFDDIYVGKSGAMGQNLVDNLINAWRSIYQNSLQGVTDVSNIFWDNLALAISTLSGTAYDAEDAIENDRLTLFGDTTGGSLEDLAANLGTALPSGSGGRMVRSSTSLVDAAAGANIFTSFYGSGSSSTDITYSTSAGSFTVTHAGYYQVEIGFTVNAVPEFSGAFNVAPAVFVGTSTDPFKIGGTAFGSYGFGLGGYARTAHSTFIVYLSAGQAVKAGYYNYFSLNDDFFTGGSANTYFSIAMLNRTDEG